MKYFLSAEIGYASRIRVLLLLPYPACDAELELLPVTSGEKQSHAALYDEAVMAVSNLPVRVSYAPGSPLPRQLPPISPNLQAVAVIPGLCLVSHEPKKCHVHWSHPELESFEMKAKVVTKTIEHLQ